MSNDSWISSAAQPAGRPPVQDRKVARINAAAEQARLDAAAKLERQRAEVELRVARQRAELELQRERREAKEQRKQLRGAARQQTRARAAAKISEALPTVGRRVMIAGPILAPMAVAWIGQIGFALGVLHWVLPGAVVFAASWELTTAFCGWMYHQARQAGDHGNVFRAATWVSATGAGVMNYWHNCPLVPHLGADGVVRKVIDVSPTPKAVAYGAMSLVGIAVWELYCSLVHRKELRARGIIPAARPRFGVTRWVRYTHITWVAWSLSIKHGHATTEQAWTAALHELARRARAKVEKKTIKARAKVEKKTAKSGRTPIRVTVIPPAGPMVRTGGPTQWTRPPIVWIPAANRTTVMDHSQPIAWGKAGTPDRSEIPELDRSQPTNTDPVSDRSGGRSETASSDRSRTASHKRTRTRSRTGKRTGPKNRTGTDLDEILDRARELDRAHLQDHGKHISADNLRAALRIAKPTALDLVKQVRGGHIDVAQ